jgi:hypothetical protein
MGQSGAATALAVAPALHRAQHVVEQLTGFTHEGRTGSFFLLVRWFAHHQPVGLRRRRVADEYRRHAPFAQAAGRAGLDCLRELRPIHVVDRSA